MNSFIFSFRPLLLAVATIAGIETAIAIVAKPNIVEQSNYLNWMYQIPEPFHKLVVHQKLSELVSSKPDIIQVGDSSGFHGIRPDVVMQSLEGLQYFNLSCCASTGFDGYYDITKFAIDHIANLRAIVVYLTFNNLPGSLTTGDQEVGATRIHDAFVGPWALIKLPSLALRPIAADIIYDHSIRGIFRPIHISDQPRALDQPNVLEMSRSISNERGWWAEHDVRKVGAKAEQFFPDLCGDDGIARSVAMGKLMSLSGDFQPFVMFDKFAALAESRGKKLIIVFHPHPCNKVDDKILRALDEAASALKSKYPNSFVYPEGLFEHWPHEVFTGADHVRVGYEQFTSRRLGRLLAGALGLPARFVPQSPPLPQVSVVRPGETPIWINRRIGNEWRLNGLVGINSNSSGERVTETPLMGRHSLETNISGLVPDRYYLVFVAYKPLGKRIVNLALRDVDTGRQSLSSCNFEAGEASRRGDFYDGSMNIDANGSVVCWGIVKLTQDRAVLSIDLMLQNGGIYYPGDGQSGLLIQEVALFMRSSPDVLLDPDARH